MLGSFVPSSRYLVRALMRHIPWEKTRVVVEYGPGVGTLTHELLDRLPPDGAVVAIESNTDFVHHLRQTIHDRRLHVVHGSAEHVGDVISRLGLGHVDCIVSGIPYSTMPPRVRETILHESQQVLRSGGLFLVYQFTGAVAPYMKRTFGAVQRQLEVRNILPARIFLASKP